MKACSFRNRKCLIFVLPFLLLGVGLTNSQDIEELQDDLILAENGGQLVESVGNLPDWPDEDWNGAIDGDIETWAGTVTVFNRPQEGDDHPWAIFAFRDEKTQLIDRARFFMLTREVMERIFRHDLEKSFGLRCLPRELGKVISRRLWRIP